jgi:XTP/dITP diphosphohydrolase
VNFLLASRNDHKLKELSALLAPHTVAAIPRDVVLPEETGSTFAANALTKARSAMKASGRAALGAALGEDSGIAVRALGGEPGIRSARYAGEGASDRDNLVKLLEAMKGVEDRQAEYVSVLALVDPDGGERLFEGRCSGRLTDRPRGSGGFGYDPIFVPSEGPGDELTMAELSAEQKNEISHRGRAARLLLDWLTASEERRG